MWSPRIHHDARVKYIGIVEAIEADIKSRKIKPGDRLPAQRFIADALSVDLTTVTRAINEAARRGLVETQPGSGCYVAQTSFTHYNSVHLSEGKPIDLSMNNPPNPPGIRLEQEIAQVLIELSYASTKPINHLSYQETVGHPEDREAGQLWLKNKVGNITSDLVLISSGAHSALFSVLSYLKRKGAKAIAAPDLSYPGLRSIADYLQLDVFGVLMDNNGIIPEHLHDICKRQKIEALYVIPNIDNPTTSTLTAERRFAIVQLAEEFNFAIIEDDPYAAFVEQHIPSFYSLASHRVWHIATVSKCLSPAFRVAYIVAPDLSEALGLAEEMRTSSLMAPPLMTAVISKWIYNGRFAFISNAIKTENEARQQLASEFFKLNLITTHPASPHLWLQLPNGHRALDFSERADRIGVSIVPSTAFVTERSRVQAVRVSLGVANNHDELKRGLSLLADLYQPGRLKSKSIV